MQYVKVLQLFVLCQTIIHILVYIAIEQYKIKIGMLYSYRSYTTDLLCIKYMYLIQGKITGTFILLYYKIPSETIFFYYVQSKITLLLHLGTFKFMINNLCNFNFLKTIIRREFLTIVARLSILGIYTIVKNSCD